MVDLTKFIEVSLNEQDDFLKVRETLTPKVDAKTAAWLAKVTAPITKPGKPANDLSNKRQPKTPSRGM